MIRRSIIPRILIPALLIAAVAFSLLGRLFAQPASLLLHDGVAVHSCGATWTADRKWIACGTILRNGFDP